METLNKAPNNEELNNLKSEIKSLRSQIDKIDLNLVNSSSLEIENLKQKISLLNNEILKNYRNSEKSTGKPRYGR